MNKAAIKKKMVSIAKMHLNSRTLTTKHYDKFYCLCVKHNIDFNSAWAGAHSLANKSIACNMNGKSDIQYHLIKPHYTNKHELQPKGHNTMKLAYIHPTNTGFMVTLTQDKPIQDSDILEHFKSDYTGIEMRETIKDFHPEIDSVEWSGFIDN